MVENSPNKHFISFGGISSKDFNGYVAGTGIYGAPKRIYSTIEIDGRNGVLTFDTKRYENASISYELVFEKTFDMENFRNLIMTKTGYSRFEDSHFPDEYRIAYLDGGFEPEMLGYGNESATVTLIFSCKPQRFLKIGEQTTTFESNGEIFNPTIQNGSPLMRIYGFGELGVGNNTLTIKEHEYEYIDIDCDLMDAYYTTVNCNSLVELSSGNFPILVPGRTGITLGEGITKVELTPRWWKL